MGDAPGYQPFSVAIPPKLSPPDEISREEGPRQTAEACAQHLQLAAHRDRDNHTRVAFGWNWLAKSSELKRSSTLRKAVQAQIQIHPS